MQEYKKSKGMLMNHKMKGRLEMMDAFEEAIFTRYAGQCAGCEHSEDRLLDTDDIPLANGMRGQARLLIQRPTLVQWVREFASHTVHFRL